jgi:serine/threonine-protein kinase
VRLALIAGRYDDAIRLLEGALSQSPPVSGIFAGEYRYLLGYAKQLAGDPASARPIYEAARTELEKTLQTEPDSPDVQMYLGFVHAALGDKEAAIRAAQKAIALRPASADAVSGAAFEEGLTRIRAQFGETDAALADLRRLLKTNYVGPEQIPLTSALLRLDPAWNPLRSDARFQQLSSEKGP